MKPTFQGVINRMPTLYRSSTYDKYTIFLKIKKGIKTKEERYLFLKSDLLLKVENGYNTMPVDKYIL